LHLRRERYARVGDAQRGEEQVFEIRDRRNDEADEVLLAEVREVLPGEERELEGRPSRQRGAAEPRGGRYAGHHLDDAFELGIGVERRRPEPEDRSGPGEATNRLDGRHLRILLARGIELRQRLLAPERGDAAQEDGGDDDREDLPRQELLVRVKEELPPFCRERARRLDEAVAPALVRRGWRDRLRRRPATAPAPALA